MKDAVVACATRRLVDSENNAIFQCLQPDSGCGKARKYVRKLILTASGGPFRETPLAQLASVTPQQAVKHPNWVMGAKISVDRSEEHTSELQSLMRISYAVFCLKKKRNNHTIYAPLDLSLYHIAHIPLCPQHYYP